MHDHKSKTDIFYQSNPSMFTIKTIMMKSVVLILKWTMAYQRKQELSMAYCKKSLKIPSGYLFGIFLPLCFLSSSIYIFWLSLWNMLAIVLSFFFDLQIMVISFISFLPLCCLSEERQHNGKKIQKRYLECHLMFLWCCFVIWNVI
jgi:hypothetical protein